ncbi:hypothetical protein V2G26_000998 [Clonostachys chloroleuca]
MTDTKDFDVIRVCRSDGVDTGPGYWPVTTPAANSIKKTAADKAPRAKPQMTRLAEDDPRFTEWRVKLGILLKQELSQSPDDGVSWYVPFPKGYWLYEKSKHLWVSGYPIKAKLFKTPQEFALHLIWLLSASMDYKDCCCVHCNVPSLPKQTPTSDEGLAHMPHESPVKQDHIPHKVTPIPVPTVVGQPIPTKSASPAQRPQATHIPPPSIPTPSVITPPTATPVPPPQIPMSSIPPQVTQPAPKVQSQVQPPQVQQHQIKQTPVHPPPIPQPQAQPTQVQQQPQAQQQPQVQPSPMVWPLKSSLLFRVGELVWYQNGQTWRLGIIGAFNNTHGFELLAIGHRLVAQQNVFKTANDMRPFHAFSVPGVTIQDLKSKNYDDVPWEAMFAAYQSDANRRDLLILDASKMAASKIDYSFSLWSPISEDPSTKTPVYYGCFFGAERIEIGDALRLKALPAEWNITTDTAVLGLRQILTNRDYPGAVVFRGHIYILVKGDSPLTNAVPEEQLPVPLRDELAWRQQTGPNSRWRWVLVKENAALKEQSIRGRFYPTYRLMPILNPAGFQQAVQQGQADEQMPQLNNRMDGMGRYIGRKRNRLDTLGASISGVHGTRLAVEPHVKEEA